MLIYIYASLDCSTLSFIFLGYQVGRVWECVFSIYLCSPPYGKKWKRNFKRQQVTTKKKAAATKILTMTVAQQGIKKNYSIAKNSMDCFLGKFLVVNPPTIFLYIKTYQSAFNPNQLLIFFCLSLYLNVCTDVSFQFWWRVFPWHICFPCETPTQRISGNLAVINKFH